MADRRIPPIAGILGFLLRFLTVSVRTVLGTDFVSGLRILVEWWLWERMQQLDSVRNQSKFVGPIMAVTIVAIGLTYVE